MDIKELNPEVTQNIPVAEIDKWVFQEKVKMLYRNQSQSWVLSILASSIIAYFSIESDNLIVGFAWWMSFIILTLLRTWNTTKFHRVYKADNNLEFKPWFNRFFVYTFIIGCTWGIGGIVIGGKLDALSQVYIFIILIGISAAAIPLLGVLQRVLLVFQIPATIPYLFYVAILLEDRGTILIFMFGLYMIGVIYAIRRLDHNLADSLGLQYEKSQLAKALSQVNQQLQSANEKLETLTQEDSLTGLHNRRYFEMKLHTEWQRELREQKVLTLMVIDIDHFKLYNDTYGHAEGDECLKKVAAVLRASLHRPADVIARIGGEEFVVLLPDVDAKGGLTLARQMQEKLSLADIKHVASPLTGHVTVSIGLASVVPVESLNELSLFKAADKALYQAKANGRNQVATGDMGIG